MLKVPTYDSLQVQERGLPSARQDSVASAKLFASQGDAFTQAGAGLMKAGGEAAQIAAKIQDRENADAVFGAEVALKNDYVSYDAEVKQNRQGAFAKNLTVDTEKWWKETASKHASTLTDVQRQLFEKRTESLRIASRGETSAFEAQQLERSHDDTWRANKVGTANLAITNPTPENVDSARAELRRLNRYQATRKGLTGEVILALDAEDLTRMHASIISNLATSNPAEAKAYYDVHKGEISGSAYDRIDNLLKAGSTRALSQTFADDVMRRGLSEADAVTHARDKLHGDDETAAVIEIKTRFAERTTARERMQRDAADTAYGIYAKTGRLSAIPADVLTQLDGRTLLALKKDAQHAAEGTEPRTDWNAYYDLRQMAMDRPDVFAKLDLRARFGKLGKGERAQLISLQAAASKPDEMKDAATLSQQLSVTHNLLDWGEGDREKKGKFDSAVTAEIENEQRRTGKKLTYSERQKVIDRMAIEGEVLSGSWFRPDPDRRFYEVAPDERARFAPTVPKADRDAIAAELKKRGKPATEAEIIKWYRKAKGL